MSLCTPRCSTLITSNWTTENCYNVLNYFASARQHVVPSWLRRKLAWISSWSESWKLSRHFILSFMSFLWFQRSWFSQLRAHVWKLFRGKMMVLCREIWTKNERFTQSIYRLIQPKRFQHWLMETSSFVTGRRTTHFSHSRWKLSRKRWFHLNSNAFFLFQPCHQSLLDWKVCSEWLSVSETRLPGSNDHKWSVVFWCRFPFSSWLEPFRKHFI